MKQWSFAATMSALDMETSAFGAATAFGAVAATISALDAETSSLDAETSALGAATSAIARSYRRYRRGVYGDIGDCGVSITPPMCNRVTNHGDMSTFSKPGRRYATPIVVRLAKHHKTLLNMVKQHETHVKHCDPS